MIQLDGKSMDIINQNIEKLKEIFPEVFSEGKIDFSKLEEELGIFKEDENERYNFTWNGKSEAKRIALTPSTGTLRPCKEESKDWDKTQNLYIEGDNLEVLKLLQKSYHKKVKMIYIDPPYNTGKDFVYKDNFRDNIKNYLEITGQVDSDGNKLSTNSETSGRYHSDWLNMMYPRLKLARNLLKDDGVIFISIDDNEVDNLTKLCNEIFGEENQFNKIIWSKSNAQNDAIGIQKNHEYILCYQKKNENIIEKKRKKVEIFKDSYGYYTKGSGFTTGGEGGILNRRPNLGHTIYFNEKTLDFIAVQDYDKELAKTSNKLKDIYKDNLDLINKGYVAIRPPKKGDLLGCWTWSLEKFNSSKNEVLINKTKNDTYSLIKKNYIDLEKYEISVESEKMFIELDYESPLNSIIEISSSNGTTALNNILGNRIFQNPKPVELIKKLILSVTKTDDIILDFFSGSGTTAHAVIELNKEIKNSNRKYILIQIPEKVDENSEAYKAGYNNICQIAKSRIDKVTKNNLGFKVLKLDTSNIKSWDSDSENLESSLFDAIENIKSDRNEEDLLYEILLKYGLDLTLPIDKPFENKNIYNIGFGALIICLDNNISIDITDEIIAIKKEYDSEITRVVFKDSGFKNATEKTNIIKTLNQNGIDEVVSV